MTMVLWPTGDPVTLASGQEVTAGGLAVQAIDKELAGLIRRGLLTNVRPQLVETSGQPTVHVSKPVTPSFPREPAVAPSTDPAFRGSVDVRWFGALGNGDQTLFPYIAETANPATDYQVKPTIPGYRLETRDGIAINMAIRHCRAQGGGSIYIPRGEYRVFCNLETINFDCNFFGDGVGQTVLKNCDASPTTHVFGLVMVFPYSSQAGGGHKSAGGVFPAKKVFIRNMTLDGNGAARAEPTAEFSCQPLRLEGAAQVTVENVHAFNSPLDSLVLQLWTDRPDCWARISNCTFGSAFRNSVSVISGSNMVFSNCMLEDGGRIHSGHSPSVCLDIEPDNVLQVGRNLKFVGCTFRNGVNGAAIAQSYTGVSFEGCYFQQAPDHNAAEFLIITHAGQVEFSNCFFDAVSAHPGRHVHVWIFPSAAVTDHRRLQFARFSGCQFVNVGMLSASGEYGSTILTNCDFKNSRTPVIFGSGRSVTMKSCTLTNVVDVSNMGTGLVAALAVGSAFKGDLDIDGVTVKFDPSQLPLEGSLALTHTLYATGAYFAPSLAATSFARIQNVFVSGYFRKYPLAHGYTPSTARFGDWRGGVHAPPDTPGPPAPGAIWYRNCTQYGDHA